MENKRGEMIKPLTRFVNRYQLNYKRVALASIKHVGENFAFLRHFIYGDSDRSLNPKTEQQTVIAAAMGVNRNTLIKIEKWGEEVPDTHQKGSYNIDTIIRIAAFFEVPIHLFYIKDGVKLYVENLRNPLVSESYRLQSKNVYKSKLTIKINKTSAEIIRPDNSVERMYIDDVLEIFCDGEDTPLKIALMRDESQPIPFLLHSNKTSRKYKIDSHRMNDFMPKEFYRVRGACHFLTIYYKDDYKFEFNIRLFKKKDRKLGW